MGEREQNYSLIHLFTLMFTSTRELEDLTDDQLLETLRAAGIDPEKEATALRNLFMRTVEELRDSDQADTSSFDAPLFDLPETPEARRQLLDKMLASHRDSTELSDDTVAILLRTYVFLDTVNSVPKAADGP